MATIPIPGPRSRRLLPAALLPTAVAALILTAPTWMLPLDGWARL